MESLIEKYFKKEVEKLGGEAIKILPWLNAGWPDRLCIFPGRKIEFVELKSAGKKPRPLQSAIHKKLASLGFPVRVLDSVEQVKKFIDEIRTA
jgi:hypothetical protein